MVDYTSEMAKGMVSTGIENSEANLVASYVTYAIAAIVLYDYIDTLEDELSMIWHRHWTSVTWLFATNRYLLVISTALQCLPYPSFQVGSHALFHDLIVTECAAYVPVDLQSCRKIERLFLAVSIIQFALTGVFSALRVYALWDRNIKWFVIIMALNLAPVVSTTYVYMHSSVMYSVHGLSCSLARTASAPSSTIFQLTLGTRLAVIMADAIVVWSTCVETYQAATDASRDNPNFDIARSLVSMLYHCALTFFVVLFIMHIVQILLDSVHLFKDFAPATLCVQPITSNLISRFTLRLRKVSDRSCNIDFTSQWSTPKFISDDSESDEDDAWDDRLRNVLSDTP